jgi:YD repeat-containing protein
MKREEYTYNAASMRTRIDYSSDAFFQPYHKLYSYDALGQLVQEHKRWSGSNASAYRYAYTYDPAGNRTQMVHFNGSTTRTVVSAYNDGNQLTTHDGNAAAYDANGNLRYVDSDSDPRELEHNSDNRLVTVWPDKGELHFVYDALGRRLARVSSRNGGVSTRY